MTVETELEKYKNMYLTMLRASEEAIAWMTDKNNPNWASHILLQAALDCEEIYIRDE